MSNGDSPEFWLAPKSAGARWRDWKLLKRIPTVVGAIAAPSTVVFGLWGIHRGNDLQEENNRLERAALDSHFEEVMMGLDRHFVSHPELRRFFYAPRTHALPARGRMRAQAMGTAELIIDFADDVGAYLRMRRMSPDDAERWTEIVRAYFDGSSPTRFAWSLFNAPYGETTACILDAPNGPKVDNWDWRSNSPRARWPRVCG